jgi:hypothetical protein
MILFWCADTWRIIIAVLMVVGAQHRDAVHRFGLASAGLLLVAYLAVAQRPMWTVYYVEILPLLYFFAATELARLFCRLRLDGATSADTGLYQWTPAASNACLAALVLFLPLGLADVARVRSAIDVRNAFHRNAQAALSAIPPGKSIVFVRYPPDHSQHLVVTRNEADLASAPQWVVYDRGAANEQLRLLSPDRAAYLLDAGTFHVERMPPLATD